MLMISPMYKIPMRQIGGGPDRLNTDRWDLDAGGTIVGRRDSQVVQISLRDQLGLKLETQKGPVGILRHRWRRKPATHECGGTCARGCRRSIVVS